MAKKKGKQRAGNQHTQQGTKSFGWILVTSVTVLVSVGLMAHLVFFQNPKPGQVASKTITTGADTAYDSRIQLVAYKFKCACGGCGELPLIECECDMPRGAKETKAFIRKQLEKGLTVDQVVEAVNKEYGHMIS